MSASKTLEKLEQRIDLLISSLDLLMYSIEDFEHRIRELEERIDNDPLLERTIQEHAADITPLLPEDYEPWGDATSDKHSLDCSMGCRWFAPLHGDTGLSSDWGVCLSPTSHRRGLLTFKHQAGSTCFEEDPSELEDDDFLIRKVNRGLSYGEGIS